MTREEIIQKGEKKFPPNIIEEIREDGSIVQTDVNATVRHAYIQGLIDNNCLLPSELDEATEESMPEEKGFLEIDIYGGSEAVYSREQMLAMFKTGAEWMARQGYTDESAYLNSIEDWGDGTAGITLGIDIKKRFPFNEREEVIIQIREK